ncbi:MAG: glycosyltransferase family 9 protein [Deltaproteobacteria bacterium]|nr:glycosyltransferase family 9 protein [Deltaproteobacteria bacterium]
MEIKSVLFIRRDNIGDLVCTTAAIRALRLKRPELKVGVIVNTYNAEVVRNNPDIDEVFVYEKGKHSSGKGRLRVLAANLGLLLRVRASGYDVAIGCGYSYSARLARYTFLTGAGIRIGFAPPGRSRRGLFYNRPVSEPPTPMHEVEAMMRLVVPLGIDGPPPNIFMRPDSGEVERAGTYLSRAGLKRGERLVAFHISSRKAVNRWPKERFRELGDMICAEFPDVKILLLWSPGGSDNPLHPGDDDRAEWIMSTMRERPVAFRTTSLAELSAAISLASMVVCCDGGAMHMAAALGKPILTVWGSTDRRRWAPWGVEHAILQKETHKAHSVHAQEAFEAFKRLYGRPA